MKTPILFLSCLFWCVFHSSSIPFGGGCENICADNDSNCWQLCLSDASFAVACGKIKACNKIREKDPNNANCKDVPKTCGGTAPPPPPPPPSSPHSCGKIQACNKIRVADPGNAKCKGVPKTCGSSPPPPPPKPLPPSSGECKCLPKELEGPGGLSIGHCLTRDPTNDKHYCYVDRNNGCRDSKPSRRLPDLLYSYQACVNQRNTGVALPDEVCSDDDEQCWLASLSSPASSEDCRDDDVQCFLALLNSPAQSGNTGFSCRSVDCGCSSDDVDCYIDCLNCVMP